MSFFLEGETMSVFKKFSNKRFFSWFLKLHPFLRKFNCFSKSLIFSSISLDFLFVPFSRELLLVPALVWYLKFQSGKGSARYLRFLQKLTNFLISLIQLCKSVSTIFTFEETSVTISSSISGADRSL